MSKSTGPILLALAVVALAGCATVPSSPEPTAPPAAVTAPSPTVNTFPPPVVNAPPPPLVSTPPPPSVAEAAPASITGSEETSTMLDNFTAFIAEIDGVPVAAGREGWNTPLSLRAGSRKLTLGFKRGVFTSQAIVELNVESRATYQVRFASDAELFGKNSYCEFWIINTATSEPVSPRVRSGLTRVEPSK